MGNSSTLFDRPFQINHIQRSLDAHGFPTTTFLVYHNVIVSVDLNKFPFCFPLLSFSTDRWVFQVEGLEGLIGPYAVVAAFACEKLGENMTFCQKKKKRKPEKKSENAQWRRLFLFQLLLIYLVFLFLSFFLNSLFCLSLWHFPIALTYERTVPTKTVWQRKEKFADTYGRVNCFFQQSLISLLFFFVVVVCLFLLSALICLTVLFFFDIFRY